MGGAVPYGQPMYGGGGMGGGRMGGGYGGGMGGGEWAEVVSARARRWQVLWEQASLEDLLVAWPPMHSTVLTVAIAVTAVASLEVMAEAITATIAPRTSM